MKTEKSYFSGGEI